MNNYEYRLMILKDLINHQNNDECKCPFECPCCHVNLIHWDMGMEGHYCNDCGYYDGTK